jgi:lauroyl/myristoyl acyltransferase
MAGVAAMTREDNHTGWRRRLGVFGDLPTRLVRSSLRVVPWFLEPLLVALWTLLFFALAGTQRRAVISNLTALFPAWGRLRAGFGAYRVFRNFAATYVDAVRCEIGAGAVDWAIDGLGSFRELAGAAEGCLVLTAHMGNYDLAAPVFAERFGRTIHAVRAPERAPEMQRIREAERREMERRFPLFKTHYNRGGEMLGVKLAQLLERGEVVAVQADRAVDEVAAMTVATADGLELTLPKGPLYLARMTRARCFPLVVARDGWRRYRVVVWPELKLPPRARGRGDDPAAAIWAEAVLAMVRPRWDQWLVFEPVLRRRKGGAA